MLEYQVITGDSILDLAAMYVETFNAEPWNDEWTLDTAFTRLHQMIYVEDFYGLCAYKEGLLCGMILGCKEQFYDGVMFNIREFCVRNAMRGQGIGGMLLDEFEKRLKDQGVKSMILYTAKGDATEHFYHKHGYVSNSGMTLMGKGL